MPDPRTLMREVIEHQRQTDKVRENYTFTSWAKTEDMDSSGKVTKTETSKQENFFVNGHVINRVVERDGKLVAGHDSDKETQRVTKLVEKAEKTSPDQPLQGPTFSISHFLDVMEVGNSRRENFHGRPTLVFDFKGRKDAKTHVFLL